MTELEVFTTAGENLPWTTLTVTRTQKKKRTKTTNIHDHLITNEERTRGPSHGPTKFTVCQLDPYNKPSIAHNTPRD